MNVGRKIKLRRKELGISAEQLAASLGVSPSTIYRYENGDIEHMGLDKLTPIAKALHTTEAYFMGWDDADTVNGDPELTEYLEMLRTRPECRMLFSVTKNATKKDVEQAVAIIEALRKQEGK
ncbi:MAG: helix-turn-helix transcriptional regulator [Oscillospiraceae bacterium]|nr:helix-turn-helix transcriptional regulator [Oscillospiraceae bacterium]